MPEPGFLSIYSYTPEPPKKSPIIKLSCGIGDTDGFPAFDVDSEQYAAKDDSKWGFLITGGAEFHMPLTVFQVTPDGLADRGGICLGNIILEINEEDATQLTLTQAHEKIDASGKKIQFLVKSMEDDELMQGYEPGEERSIVLRVPKPAPPPKVSTIEKRLDELQRKLSEIAEIPKILSSTLATVSKTFDKLNTTLPTEGSSPLHCHNHFHSKNVDCAFFLNSEQNRKLSYDEDVYDYELSDDENKNEDFTNNEEDFNAEEAYLQLKHYAASQRKLKDVTPESDYESESNFPQKETKDMEQDDSMSHNDDIYEDNDIEKNAESSSYDDEDEDDVSEKSCDMYEEFNLSILKTSVCQFNNQSDIEEFNDENDDGINEKRIEDDEDFLTTTFTWSLPNRPPVQAIDKGIHNDNHKYDDNDDDNGDGNVNVNGDAGDAGDADLESKLENKPVDVQEAADEFNVEQLKSLNNSKEVLKQKAYKAETPEKEQKMDKLERCWPWADREKIIYKQSTCHLVPHKPLGLIEQRIQLLAKRNLLEHISKIRSPQ